MTYDSLYDLAFADGLTAGAALCSALASWLWMRAIVAEWMGDRARGGDAR